MRSNKTRKTPVLGAALLLASLGLAACGDAGSSSSEDAPDVEVAEDRPREVPAPAGEHEGEHNGEHDGRHQGEHEGRHEGQGRRGVVTVRDAVLRARRR